MLVSRNIDPSRLHAELQSSCDDIDRQLASGALHPIHGYDCGESVRDADGVCGTVQSVDLNRLTLTVGTAKGGRVVEEPYTRWTIVE